MFEDFLYDLRVLDASDDLHLASALLTLLYLYGGRPPRENPFQSLHPSHGISLIPRLIQCHCLILRPCWHNEFT